MLDKILVFLSMVGLVAFCGVVVTFVAEPDLAITVALILFIASHDFWISVFRKQDEEPALEDTTLESRPHGVSGRVPTQEEVQEATGQSPEKPSRKKKGKS